MKLFTVAGTQKLRSSSLGIKIWPFLHPQSYQYRHSFSDDKPWKTVSLKTGSHSLTTFYGAFVADITVLPVSARTMNQAKLADITQQLSFIPSIYQGHCKNVIERVNEPTGVLDNSKDLMDELRVIVLTIVTRLYEEKCRQHGILCDTLYLFCWFYSYTDTIVCIRNDFGLWVLHWKCTFNSIFNSTHALCNDCNVHMMTTNSQWALVIAAVVLVNPAHAAGSSRSSPTRLPNDAS